MDRKKNSTVGKYKRTPEIRLRISNKLKQYFEKNPIPKGRPLSEEHKQKLSVAHKGKTLSESHKANLSGRIPWNKGKKMSPESCAKMSESGKGRVVWNKGLKGYHAGSQHHNWQGGKTQEAERIRKSSEYKEWRRAVFSRDNYTCQICEVRGEFLHADHILPFCAFPELRLVVSNGRTLCVPCHRKSETYGRKAIVRKQDKNAA